jgi:hypothetical protein
MSMKPEYVICGRNGLEIVIYRAPRPRGVWGKALMLSVVIWLLAIMTLVAHAERPALERINYVTNVDAAIAAATMPTCRGWWY